MSTDQNLYKILGLPAWATPEEIRRAYRERIKTCHPDLCSTATPSKIERFQILTRAYETLLKKSRYIEKVDQTPRTKTFHTPRPMEDGVFLFLEVSAQQALLGAVIETEIWDGEEFCFKCSGSGRISEKGQKICPACKGKGHTSIPWGKESLSMVCKKCSGSGFIEQPICPVCKGRGRISRPRKIRIPLPRGITSGTLLKLPGQGAYMPEHQTRNSLYVEIGVRLPENWCIQGLDILAPVDLDIWTAIEGGEIAVRTIDGYDMCRVPPCVKHGDLLRLSGKGWSNEMGKRGDHVAKVRLIMPPGRPSSLVKTFLRILKRLWPAVPSVPALPHHHKVSVQKIIETTAI